MASTTSKPRYLFALDFMNMPCAPDEIRAREIARFHSSNPDGIACWYATPHTGPENPDYMRRTHGIYAYLFNYGGSANYCLYRADWNDWAGPYEPFLRGLLCVYATRDSVLDTLAWEGIREGLDDVRYATLLKEKAMEALKSPSSEVYFTGREALNFIAYFDPYRDSADLFRMECIDWILKLDEALKGDKTK